MSNLLAPGDYAITINPSTNPFCLYKIGTLDRNDNYNGKLLLTIYIFGRNTHVQTFSCGL